MCAGASTRFFGQDKFLCPLEIPSKKCILQLMLERTANNIEESGNKNRSIPIVFCCNENNRHSIEEFLVKNSYFGFNHKKVRFVQVQNLPILSNDGKFCISFEYKILSRPGGTGKCSEQVLRDEVY